MSLNLRGSLEITLRRHHLDDPPKKFKVIRTKNLFVTSGVEQLRDLMMFPDLQGDGFTPAYAAVGSSGTATIASMTTMGLEVFRGPITRRIPLPDGFRVELFLLPSEANGSGSQDLREIGLFTPSSGGKLWARAVHSLIVKNSSISVTYTWTYEIVGV